MKKIFAFILLLSLSCLLSCGKDGASNDRTILPQTHSNKQQAAEENYRAILRPFNNHLSGFLPSGTAEIKISGDSVQVKTLLDDDARVVHMQSIHEGTVCPRIEEHDVNGDGLVDVIEAQKASGKVFIPLDNDLDSFEEGQGIYPLGGNYTYIESASLSRFESDVKARTGRSLNLTDKVVIIHGVNGATQMPQTVATLGDMTRQASIPIACGILQRVK